MLNYRATKYAEGPNGGKVLATYTFEAYGYAQAMRLARQRFKGGVVGIKVVS